MADLLLATDTLAQGFPKINVAILQSEQALTASDNAIDTANNALIIGNTALNNSEDTQQQLDNIIIASGTSDAETIQARGTFPLLYERLNDVDLQLASMAVQVENYGAVGDGTTSDSIAFQDAISNALSSKFPAIQLQQGKTYLLKGTDVAEYDGVFIFGNGATIKLDGIVRFNFSNLDTLILKNLIVETNVGFTEDNTLTYNHIFYSAGPNQVLYDIENLYFKSNASQTPKISRYPSAFSLYNHKSGSRIRNIYFENFGFGIIVYDGTGIEISNIKGENIETLVYMRNPKDATINDLSLKNTYAQSLTWIGKIDLSGGTNGKDTLMVEGGDRLSIHDIYGEFCIERVLYCQSSHVVAHDLYAKDCAGFKFCGSSYATRNNKAIISNLNKIVTDDITTIDTDLLFRILDLYYISDVEVDGVKLKNFRSDKLTQLGTYVITIADDVHNVKLKNIDCEYNSPLPLIYFFVLQDTTKTCSDIEVENYTIRNYGDSTGEYYVFTFGGTVPVSWINGLHIHDGKIVQNDSQITSNDIGRRAYDILSKKAINVKINNVEEGYLTRINFQETTSDFVSDNIAKIETKQKFIINSTDNNFNIYYYSVYASGGGTRYLPKARLEITGVNYKARNSLNDTLKIVYENRSNTAARLYDAAVSAEFNMLIDGTLNTWDLPFNIVGHVYLVEVESSVGCGKAIFTGTTVTEIYKTGNLVFDTTASKLRVYPKAGTGADYLISINNAISATTRLNVKVTLLNTL
jgi:hypothetical protein